MKTVETLTLIACIFLVTWTHGDGAPQWRPQGRFGKRFISGVTSPILSALDSETTPNEVELLQQDMAVDNSNLISQLLGNMASNQRFDFSPRICKETEVPNVFKCSRQKRSAKKALALLPIKGQ